MSVLQNTSPKTGAPCASDPDSQDILNDLAENGYLLNDLVARAREIQSTNEHQTALFAKKLVDLKDTHARQLRAVEQASKNLSPADFRVFSISARSEQLALKSLLRECFRELGHRLCSNDWQSPVYASSFGLGENRLTAGIAEHKLDYKRDGHLEAAEYERDFLKEYVHHLGSREKANAYLTNSGMAAYTTSLHWLAHEQRMGSSTVAIAPMYFENIHLALGFFPGLVTRLPSSENSLLEELRTNKPSVVLVDDLTNCNEVLVHDIETILNWAITETSEPTAIVIDTTCLPSALLPQNMLDNIPDHLIVILIESLAKHHQFGMDAVTGGVVVMHALTALHESFQKTRARFGGNITDISAAALPKPDATLFKTRMARHSRNVRQLVERTSKKIEAKSGIIESFSWLSEPASFAPEFHGTCLTIHLKEEFRSVAKYQEFEQHVLNAARQCELPLALSTSFGFDVSRLYVTAPGTPFEPPFLRVAIGTETIEQIEIFAEIIASAHKQLVKTWKLETKN